MSQYSLLILGFALLFASARSRQVDPKEFIQLALAVSKAAYLPSHFISHGYIQEASSRGFKNACNVGNWQAFLHDNRETEVYLFRHDSQKLAVFGFRGTEPTNLIDWAKNFDVWLVSERINGKWFRLHKGFRDRYRVIEAWFRREYKAIPEDYTIILTGHSLGGAMATISAAFTTGPEIDRAPDAVITFGSPRVGNTYFQRYYHDFVGCTKTIRMTEKDDIITTVPASKIGYTHVCTAQEVSNRVSDAFWNIVRNHDLYSGYGKGLQIKYRRNMSEINLGCNRIRQGFQ